MLPSMVTSKISGQRHAEDERRRLRRRGIDWLGLADVPAIPTPFYVAALPSRLVPVDSRRPADSDRAHANEAPPAEAASRSAASSRWRPGKKVVCVAGPRKEDAPEPVARGRGARLASPTARTVHERRIRRLTSYASGRAHQRSDGSFAPVPVPLE